MFFCGVCYFISVSDTALDRADIKFVVSSRMTTFLERAVH